MDAALLAVAEAAVGLGMCGETGLSLAARGWFTACVMGAMPLISSVLNGERLKAPGPEDITTQC